MLIFQQKIEQGNITLGINSHKLTTKLSLNSVTLNDNLLLNTIVTVVNFQLH